VNIAAFLQKREYLTLTQHIGQYRMDYSFRNHKINCNLLAPMIYMIHVHITL